MPSLIAMKRQRDGRFPDTAQKRFDRLMVGVAAQLGMGGPSLITVLGLEMVWRPAIFRKPLINHRCYRHLPKLPMDMRNPQTKLVVPT